MNQSPFLVLMQLKAQYDIYNTAWVVIMNPDKLSLHFKQDNGCGDLLKMRSDRDNRGDTGTFDCSPMPPTGHIKCPKTILTLWSISSKESTLLEVTLFW